MTKRNGKLIASLLAGFAIVAAFAQGASAQRARSVSNRNEGVSTGSVPPAPPTIKAKYEGGMFGYNQKLEGALTFDDRSRLAAHSRRRDDDLEGGRGHLPQLRSRREFVHHEAGHFRAVG